MDYFSLCLEGLCLIGQALLHMRFVCRFTGKTQRLPHLAAYLLLLCCVEALSVGLRFPDILPIGMELAALYGMSRFALGNPRQISCTAVVLAVSICQLSFGIVNSVESILFPEVGNSPLLYPLVVLATLAVFAICTLCYAAVLRLLPLPENAQMPYVGLLLFPGLFFFAAEQYILHTAYSVISLAELPSRLKTHGALLVLQVLGLAALLCALYAYQQICRSFQVQSALQALTQAARAQKIYIAEAQARYEQTKAFRHDIKNHFAVLDGLLHSGKIDESSAYLQKLEAVSSSLSCPYQTGNPVVDILLGEKLALARADGVISEVSLTLPQPCGIDDFDLCVIFANALDNAIHACRLVKGEKSIHISGRRQGDFYLLTFENTCSEEPPSPPGTGLANIQSAAEKYHGAVLTEKTNRQFSLSVLLNIS